MDGAYNLMTACSIHNAFDTIHSDYMSLDDLDLHNSCCDAVAYGGSMTSSCFKLKLKQASSLEHGQEYANRLA